MILKTKRQHCGDVVWVANKITCLSTMPDTNRSVSYGATVKKGVLYRLWRFVNPAARLGRNNTKVKQAFNKRDLKYIWLSLTHLDIDKQLLNKCSAWWLLCVLGLQTPRCTCQLSQHQQARTPNKTLCWAPFLFDAINLTATQGGVKQSKEPMQKRL